MKNKDYITVSMVIFLVIGAGHLWRAFNQMSVNLGATEIPVAVSWIAGVAGLYLAYSAYKLRS